MVRGTAGIGLFAFGDLLAQKLEHHRKVDRGKALEPVWTWDSDRAFRTSSWRAVMWAPAATVFWNALDRNVKIGGFRGELTSWAAPYAIQTLSTSNNITLFFFNIFSFFFFFFFLLFFFFFISPGSLIKIAIDFCTIGPVITYSYLSWCKTWELGPEHATVSSVVAHSNDRFFTVISRSYVYWMPLHLITYGVVPLRHRLVWVSLCSVGFAALLSFTNSEFDDAQAEIDAGEEAVSEN